MTYEVTLKNISVKQQYQTRFDDGKITKEFESFKELIHARGFFETPFPVPPVTKEEVISFVSVADISFFEEVEDNRKNNYNLVVGIFDIDWHRNDFYKLNLSIHFDEKTIACVKKLAEDDEASLTIQFEIDEWINEHSAKARITRIDESRTYLKRYLIEDYEIKDIANYLIKENCLNIHAGQLSDICKEFAKSFHHVPASVNKGEILDSINSLLAGWRYTFHGKLDEHNSSKLKPITEKYGFALNTDVKKINDELSKITERKDREQALRIYNTLWIGRTAENTLRNGFNISKDEAQSLVDEYLKLEYVFSETCERILLDILISCDISEYVSVAQYRGLITQSTPFFIEAGMYKPEFVLNKNKGIKEAILQGVFDATFHLVGRVISGLISWWISGLIAGENETAHFVLFGTMFAADTVLMGMYQTQKMKKDEKIGVSKEQHCYDIVKHMCNLHYHSYHMDTKLMRHILNQLASMGFKSQAEIFRIISLIESRK